MPESIAAHGELPDLLDEQRNEVNSFLKGQDLGIPSESSDEGVTDSDHDSSIVIYLLRGATCPHCWTA
jgi:hypothetical protein